MKKVEKNLARKVGMAKRPPQIWQFAPVGADLGEYPFRQITRYARNLPKWVRQTGIPVSKDTPLP